MKKIIFVLSVFVGTSSFASGLPRNICEAGRAALNEYCVQNGFKKVCQLRGTSEGRALFRLLCSSPSGSSSDSRLSRAKAHCWRGFPGIDSKRACYWGAEIAADLGNRMDALVYCSEKAADESERIHCEAGAALYFTN